MRKPHHEPPKAWLWKGRAKRGIEDLNLNFEFVDNSAEMIAALHDTCERALWRCGEKAEGYAKNLAPVDTGNLRNSITHAEHAEAGGGEMYVGTDVNYAVYQEMGTGVYAEKSSPHTGGTG